VLAEELQGHDHGDEAVAVALEFEGGEQLCECYEEETVALEHKLASDYM
jgi:hypothetical protein